MTLATPLRSSELPAERVNPRLRPTYSLELRTRLVAISRLGGLVLMLSGGWLLSKSIISLSLSASYASVLTALKVNIAVLTLSATLFRQFKGEQYTWDLLKKGCLTGLTNTIARLIEEHPRSIFSNPESECLWDWAAAGENSQPILEMLSNQPDATPNIWTLSRSLVFAAMKGRNENIIYLLERYGIDINSAPFRSSPMLFAAMYGQVSTVELLIRRGCEVDRPNYRGETPLMAAFRSSENYEEICALLISHGADPRPALTQLILQFLRLEPVDENEEARSALLDKISILLNAGSNVFSTAALRGALAGLIIQEDVLDDWANGEALPSLTDDSSPHFERIYPILAVVDAYKTGQAPPAIEDADPTSTAVVDRLQYFFERRSPLPLRLLCIDTVEGLSHAPLE